MLTKKLFRNIIANRKGVFNMYDVLTVSRYIVNYSNEKGYGISNLKLQKILYFVQAWFLIEVKEPCFKEEIEAWEFGPVVPVVYHEFKRFGSSYIPTVKSYFNVNENNIWDVEREKFNDKLIKENDKKIINAVVDKFSECSANYLVKVTHKQKPWKDAYAKGSNSKITQESLRSYFCNE